MQTGNQKVGNITQNIGGDSQLIALIQQLRHYIVDETPEKQREGNELLEGLQSEIIAPSPSESRIRLYLKALGPFVRDGGKDLLVEIGSKVIGSQLGFPS